VTIVFLSIVADLSPAFSKVNGFDDSNAVWRLLASHLLINPIESAGFDTLTRDSDNYARPHKTSSRTSHIVGVKEECKLEIAAD
jgi:hypothetical protein